MTKVYVTTENSDLTEGKGHIVFTGIFTDLAAAVIAVKGRNVMGVGDGEVFEVETNKRSSLITTKVYGYRPDLAGKWGYGYVDNRDAPINDPEYQEYLRLKKKFNG